jgi:hypothetical protein
LGKSIGGLKKSSNSLVMPARAETRLDSIGVMNMSNSASDIVPVPGEVGTKPGGVR